MIEVKSKGSIILCILIMAVFVILFSTAVHEVGHWAVAKFMGFEPEIRPGWNCNSTTAVACVHENKPITNEENRVVALGGLFPLLFVIPLFVLYFRMELDGVERLFVLLMALGMLIVGIGPLLWFTGDYSIIFR